MWILYYLAISAYGRAIRIAARFNPKAKAWIEGRKNWHDKLKSQLGNDPRKRIWFHCASLGEFEQGKPVMEAMRKAYPDHLIVVSFFSPSGYEVRKNEKVADAICYMPLDGPIRSKKFISVVNPSMVFFVKYEFWYFYGKELSARKIPYYCISAVFRPNQVFFHSLGLFFRKMLTRHSQIFVQDQESLQLLYKARITSVTVSGDTRYDRVVETLNAAVELPEIKAFCGDAKIFIAGSTWPGDEEVLLPVVNEGRPGLKFIIAPHEIARQRVLDLKGKIQRKVVLYSEWKEQPQADAEVLIIDNVGLLSRIYRYGHFAWVGGGFGTGLHNILEAVVYGLPVYIGPHHQKFREARELIDKGTVFSVHNYNEFCPHFDTLLNSDEALQHIRDTDARFIESKRGATKTIMSYLEINYLG